MISNEIETSGGHISGTTASWEVPLGFLDAPRFPLQKYIKIRKVPKSREIAIFGRPFLRFSIKIETSGGHNSLEYPMELEAPKWIFGCPLDTSQ